MPGLDYASFFNSRVIQFGVACIFQAAWVGWIGMRMDFFLQC